MAMSPWKNFKSKFSREIQGITKKNLNGESQFKANENVTSHFETQNDDFKGKQRKLSIYAPGTHL